MKHGENYIELEISHDELMESCRLGRDMKDALMIKLLHEANRLGIEGKRITSIETHGSYFRGNAPTKCYRLYFENLIGGLGG